MSLLFLSAEAFCSSSRKTLRGPNWGASSAHGGRAAAGGLTTACSRSGHRESRAKSNSPPPPLLLLASDAQEPRPPDPSFPNPKHLGSESGGWAGSGDDCPLAGRLATSHPPASPLAGRRTPDLRQQWSPQRAAHTRARQEPSRGPRFGAGRPGGAAAQPHPRESTDSALRGSETADPRPAPGCVPNPGPFPWPLRA